MRSFQNAIVACTILTCSFGLWRGRVNGQTCMDNITSIVQLEKIYDTSDVLVYRRTYYLCPNMVYPMGVYDESLGMWVNGNEPIVPRVNMTIQCGLDGSSDNNCILEGGLYGFLQANQTERVDGVVVQGLTFRSQSLAAIALQYEGSISFVDCIIEQQNTSSPVVMLLRYTRRRHLPGADTADGTKDDNVKTTELISNPLATRRLQGNDGASTATLHASFQECVFRDNHGVAVDESGGLGPGLITVDASQGQIVSLSIQTSMFVKNYYGSNDTNGWAIQTNGPLSLQSNCWIDNEFWGPAPIQVLNNASFHQNDNFDIRQSGNVSCPFASVEVARDLSSFESQCIPSQSSVCALLPPLVVASSASRPIITTAPSQAPVYPTSAAISTRKSPTVTRTIAIFLNGISALMFVLL